MDIIQLIMSSIASFIGTYFGTVFAREKHKDETDETGYRGHELEKSFTNLYRIWPALTFIFIFIFLYDFYVSQQKDQKASIRETPADQPFLQTTSHFIIRNKVLPKKTVQDRIERLQKSADRDHQYLPIQMKDTAAENRFTYVAGPYDWDTAKLIHAYLANLNERELLIIEESSLDQNLERMDGR